MTREEAITILEGMRIDIPVPKAAVTQRKRNVALDMAISALSCSEIPNSSDLISRQAAIDAIEKNACNTQRIFDAVKALPPAEPKTGKWIYQKGMIKCDQCLRAIRRIDNDGLLNFCPNCGADMRGERNEP